MSKTFCVVPANWTAEEIEASRCYGGSHYHASFREIYGIRPESGDRYGKDGNGWVGLGMVEWILWPRVLRFTRLLPMRGLSALVGAKLAIALRLGRPWAKVMLAEIRRERWIEGE